jgi:hypothetical protein
VHNLLGKVAAMGPLVSLLKANIMREEFLRTNRDLLDTFGILAGGEQLLVRPLHRTQFRTAALGACSHDPDKMESLVPHLGLPCMTSALQCLAWMH